MKTKSHAFCFVALIVVALIPLNAEESGPKPDPGTTEQQPVPQAQTPQPIPRPATPPIPNASKRPKREHRTLVVAELRDIRFNVAGSITFRHPSTEDIYEWFAPRVGESREVVLATVLTELRRAEKIDVVCYSPQREGGGNVDHRFMIDEITLVYDSLK